MNQVAAKEVASRRWLLWAPLAVFVLLFGLAAMGLIRPGSRENPSQLVGKSIPALALPAIVSGHGGFSSASSGPRLINIFASWCVPCAVEVGQLERLEADGIAVDGIAVRDTAADLGVFLGRYGNPYRAIGSDPESQSMIALGSSGVPESFVVDAGGIIRYQHIGAIGAQDLDDIRRAYEAAR